MAFRLSPHLTVMANAAHKAAKRLLRDFNEVEQLQVSVKGPSDFVSQADIRAEQTLREELNKAKLRRSMVVLRAEQDSVVQSLAKVSVGSVMMSGQPFITLAPAGAALEVEANVPGSEAGFVHVGDPVAVKFDTFPFSQYGMVEGGVRVLSPNSFTPQDEARNPTSSAPVAASGEPFYRARVSMDHIGLHGTPPGFHMTPGMPVTADIKVGRRTVLKYFLGKVLPIAQEGLREPQN